MLVYLSFELNFSKTGKIDSWTLTELLQVKKIKISVASTEDKFLMGKIYPNDSNCWSVDVNFNYKKLTKKSSDSIFFLNQLAS